MNWRKGIDSRILRLVVSVTMVGCSNGFEPRALDLASTTSTVTLAAYKSTCRRLLAPQPPSNLRASAGSNQVTLTWSASSTSSVTAYIVRRNGTVVASTYKDALTYTDRSVLPSTGYSYTVQAQDNCQKVSTQISVSVTTLAAPAPTP
ncbi:MAG: hypothetical protein AAB250_18800, partial [Bdellovibrionota bacterium]